MPNHLHRQIREAVKAQLTGLTTTATRVYPNRLQPLGDGNLPGLRIFMDDEEATALTMHSPYMQERTLTLIVECCAKVSDALDNTLDQISKEVENALSPGISLGGQIIPAVYAGMQFDDAISDKPAGVKRLRFAVSYTAQSNAPDVLT